MITIEKKNENTFKVIVKEGSSQTTHTVTLDDTYYQQVCGAKISKESLIERSFDFLLKHEPKESILSSFNLTVIRRYFPSYEKEIQGLV